MKKRKVDPWFPFWIDKWLFGSTRIELKPDERGVFVDLMALSKKDDGWVRANEGVPYLERQLSGILNITPELLNRTIEKCIKYNKAERFKDGTIYMTSHEVYQLSPRQERRIESEMTDKKDIEAKKEDTILDKNKLNNNILDNKDNIHSIIKHWNSQKIKTLEERESNIRKKTNSKIQKQLKDYSVDEISEAISNYSIILKEDKYFFSYSWQLWEFLDRGLINFLTKNEPFKNYLSDKDKGSTKEEQRKKDLDDWTKKQ